MENSVNWVMGISVAGLCGVWLRVLFVSSSGSSGLFSAFTASKRCWFWCGSYSCPVNSNPSRNSQVNVVLGNSVIRSNVGSGFSFLGGGSSSVGFGGASSVSGSSSAGLGGVPQPENSILIPLTLNSSKQMAQNDDS